MRESNGCDNIGSDTQPPYEIIPYSEQCGYNKNTGFHCYKRKGHEDNTCVGITYNSQTSQLDRIEEMLKKLLDIKQP